MKYTEEELFAAERTYWTDEIEEAKAASKAEGRAEGKAEGRAGSILSLHSKGETSERISFLLGMPLEEVKDIIRANG